MPKLKKLLIILTCFGLIGCSTDSTKNGLSVPKETGQIESEIQISSKTIPSESANTNNSNSKKYKTRLGNLLLNGEDPSYISNVKELTESGEILKTIHEEMDIDFSQIDNCVGKALYIKQNSPYNYYGALSAPKDQYQKIQSMLEAIPHNGDRPHSWNMTKNPKYGKDYFEYNLIVGRECLRYSRWDYRQEPKYFVDQLFLIPQGTEIIIYILRDQGWIN